MISDGQFPKGLFIKAPREGAPDFVKGTLSLKLGEAKAYLDTLHGEWVNFDIKTAKESGKWYLQLNTWKPEENKPKASATVKQLFKDDQIIPF